MNEYCVTITFHGLVSYEDPKCPWNWRGSGVYTIEENVNVPGECHVTAESAARAEEIVNEYDFTPSDFTLEDIDIDEIVLVGPVEDDADEEVFDVSISDIPVSDGYEPDPDDYYEEELIRRREEENEEDQP